MIIDLPLEFAQIIRERRRSRGLTQAQLAARVGKTRQWLIGVENGQETYRASLGNIMELLSILELTTSVTPDEDAHS